MIKTNTQIKFVHCHQIPERSFHFKGKPLPLCARCTGFYFGYLSIPFFLFNIVQMSILWSSIIIIPTVVDGLTQAYMNRESNNLLRFITGLAAGIGLISLVSILGKFIGNLIFN